MKKLFPYLLMLSFFSFACTQQVIDNESLNDNLVGDWSGQKSILSSHLINNNNEICPINYDIEMSLTADGKGLYNSRSIEWHRTIDDATQEEKIFFAIGGSSYFSVWIERDEPYVQQWRSIRPATDIQEEAVVRWSLRKNNLSVD